MMEGSGIGSDDLGGAANSGNQSQGLGWNTCLGIQAQDAYTFKPASSSPLAKLHRCLGKAYHMRNRQLLQCNPYAEFQVDEELDRLMSC